MFFENVGLDQLQVLNGLAEFRVKIKRQSPHRLPRKPGAFQMHSAEICRPDIAWSFCRIPYAILQGILEPNLIPSREFESRSREFSARLAIPTRRDFGLRARLVGAALAGGHGCVGATRISAPTSITNPSASLAPLFRFLARDAELGLPKPAEPVIFGTP
jgi:hypothetical protein